MALNLQAFTDFARPQQAAFDGLNQGLASLGTGISEFRDRQSLADLGALAQKGDYAGAAAQAFATGKGELGLGLLSLKQEMADQDVLRSTLGGAAQRVSAAPASAEGGQMGAGSGDLDRAATAIAATESGGRYDILGPKHPKYGYAVGKYQVMESNIPSWTREALGREMTTDEFLNSPEAQDAVFKHRFGGYVAKYGNMQDAASAWFSGRPIREAGNASDALGTTVPAYVAKFNRGLQGQGAPSAPIVADNEEEVQAAEQATGMMPPRPVQIAQADTGIATEATAADTPAGGAKEAQFRIPGDPSRIPLPVDLQSRIGTLEQALAQVRSPNARATLQARLGQAQQEAQQYRADQFRQLGEERKTARDIQLKTARAVTDPTERARLGVPEGYKGVVQVDGYGAVSFPGKAGVEVNNVQTSESEFAKKTGGALSERFDKISQEGDSGRSDLALIGQIKGLGGAINQSTMPAFRAKLAEYGLRIGDDIGAVQAYESLIDKLTPSQRIPGAGATSDFDARMFKSSLPRLMNTPEGNALVIGTLEALAQDKIARAQIADQAITGDLRPADAIKQLRALPSPNLVLRSGLSELAKSGKLGTAAAQSETATQQPAPATRTAARAPAAGAEEDGYVFLGGDPSKPSSWRRK